MSEPKLAYCERVTASPFSPWHIRRVGVEGLKLGGGAPNTVLCGADLGKGWDLRSPVDDESLRRLQPDICKRCFAAVSDV